MAYGTAMRPTFMQSGGGYGKLPSLMEFYGGGSNSTAIKLKLVADQADAPLSVRDSADAEKLSLSSAGALTIASALTVSAGGASISGGLNLNSGGITNAGSIAGASTGAFSSNVTVGGTLAVTSTLSSGAATLASLNNSNGGITNAGAISGATTGAFSSNVTVGGTLGVTGGVTLSSTLALGGNVTGSGYDLGTNGARLGAIYCTTIDATTIVGAGSITGTTVETFAINSDQTDSASKLDIYKGATAMSLSFDGTTTSLNKPFSVTGTITGSAGLALGGAVTGVTNLTMSGALSAASGAFSAGVTIGTTLAVTSTLSAATGSTIGNLTFANGSITDSGGAISFGNENLSTTGTLASGALTVTGTGSFSDTLSCTKGSGTGLSVTSDASIGGNLTVTGNLVVNGDTFTVNTATLTVEDPLIALASGNNATDVVDIGFYGLYDTSGTQDLYCGLYRDASDGKFKLFKSLQAAPDTTVNVAGAGYDHADLQVGGLTVDDALQVSGASTLASLTVVGNAGIGGTLGVTGVSTYTGQATFNGGIVSTTGSFSSNLSGTTGSFSGNFSAGNNKFSINAATGAASFTDDLTVSGALTASTTLSVTGGSTLTGAVSCGDALSVTGATTLTGALYANGNVDRSSAGTLSIGAATQTGLLLSRTGVATTVNGSLTVVQAFAANAAATFTNNLLQSDGLVSLAATSGMALSVNTVGAGNAIFMGKAYVNSRNVTDVNYDVAAEHIVCFDATNRTGVALAKADALATSRVVGVARAAALTSDAVAGVMAHSGVVAVKKPIAEAWAVGDPIYLSAATAGTATKTAPSTEGSTFVTFLGYAADAVVADASATGYIHFMPSTPVAN